ncbi:carbonic anhydrase CynT [Gottschalkia acidurici 9a]|uniref:carbonic anhydrase n=1 Tax=Gottschalkia acidurici (strain ATCC 7906 / DSM 604 / BCRC 14475 / CIP 104303 / KCTC 5404 / NCIMB 10678 / 9a) TaxID=1128398 RepID=K0B1F4_GOTA9|nr:carbonic anhydrase [Gottschalkia acidurici]AFS78887.1 carbonic anhydrase CynT [Gottschalkia acidurici 9a]
MKAKALGMILSAGILTLTLTGCDGEQKQASVEVNQQVKQVYTRPDVTNPEDAKKLLLEGNKRFISGEILNKDLSKENLKKLSMGQKPLAVIVGCSDSRVNPEIIFDQGLGDLFVIRDAGNVIDKITMGSVEYGVEQLGAPLIVVLGHEKCGAVEATVNKAQASENIQGIIEKINISLEGIDNNASKDKIYAEVEDKNIENTVNEIKREPVIENLIKENKVQVIGAKYHIETGEVVFE